MDSEELERLRERINKYDRDVGTPASSPGFMLGRVEAGTTDLAFQKLQRMTVKGTELEGSAAVFTEGSAAITQSIALGNAPDLGSLVVSSMSPWRWAHWEGVVEVPPEECAFNKCIIVHGCFSTPLEGVLWEARLAGVLVASGTTGVDGKICWKGTPATSYAFTLTYPGPYYNVSTFSQATCASQVIRPMVTTTGRYCCHACGPGQITIPVNLFVDDPIAAIKGEACEEWAEEDQPMARNGATGLWEGGGGAYAMDCTYGPGDNQLALRAYGMFIPDDESKMCLDWTCPPGYIGAPGSAVPTSWTTAASVTCNPFSAVFHVPAITMSWTCRKVFPTPPIPMSATYPARTITIHE